MGAEINRGLIVGREQQLAAIESALQSAAAGHGGILVVSAEAGYGKTRLIAAMQDAATRAGFLTLSSANLAYARAPFGMWSDVMAPAAARLPQIAPASRADRPAFEHFIGRDVAEPPAIEKRRLFVILAGAIERAATIMPLAFTFDDIHWADPESLEFLDYLAPRLRNSRTVVTLTARGDELDDELTDALHRIKRFEHTQMIDLPALTGEQTREMIAALLPVQQRLPRSIVDEICVRAEGNALFVRELVHEALRSPASTLLPESIAVVAGRRLRALPERQQAVIETASVLGSPFSVNDLIAISGASRAECISVLRAAIDQHIVVQATDDVETFTFRHELLRLAIYDRLLALQRRELHRAVAERFETNGNVSAALLAHHWSKAGESERSADYFERGGDEALARNAYASARHNFETALAHREAGPLGPSHLLAKIGRAADLMGDSAAAVDHLRIAAELARAIGNVTDALQWELACVRAAHRSGQTALMVQLCNRIIAEATDDTTRFAALSLLAAHHAYRNEGESADAILAACDSLDGDHAARDRLNVEWARAVTALFRMDQRWRSLADRAVMIAEESRDAGLLAFTLLNVAGFNAEQGDPDRADSALSRAIALADEHGLTFASAYARCEMIQLHYLRGELPQAVRLVRQTVGLHTEAETVRIFLGAIGLCVLTEVQQLGELPALRDTALLGIAAAMGEGYRFANLAAAHGYAHVTLGETPAAHELFDRALAAISTFSYAGQALLLIARFGTTEQIEHVAQIMGDAPPAGAARLDWLAISAVIAARRGDDGQAGRAAAVAFDAAERLGARLHAALMLAIMKRTSDAVARFAACGSLAGIRQLQPRRNDPLTPREREIADLVARGLTNRAIAERCTLSERTVEHHISAVYAKLGFRTRSEFIAASRSASSMSGA